MTDAYYIALDKLLSLFGGYDYSSVYSFILEVVESVEDGTFMDKYGVPDKKSPALSRLNEIKAGMK